MRKTMRFFKHITFSIALTITTINLAFSQNFPMTPNGNSSSLPIGTAGGLPYYVSPYVSLSSGTLTANNPIFGGGAGSAPFSGAKSGNTNTLASISGTLINGHCISIDSNFNLIDSGSPCGTGSISSGTQNQLGWYALTGNTISGLATANNGVLVTSSGGVPSISSTLPSAVQLNITSLGTINTGIWQASVVGAIYGGTGLASGTSGGILGFTSSTTIASSAVLTANNPVLGGGVGATPFSGSKSGNTNKLASVSGSLINGDCVSIDGNMNLIDAGGPCGTGTGSGTVTAGAVNNLAYYNVAGNTVVGLATANNGTLITSNTGVPSISSTLPTAVQGNITSLGTIISGIWNGSVIPVLYGGTGLSTITSNGIPYGNGSGTLNVTAQGGAHTIFVANSGAPSWSSSPTIGTSVTTPILNLTGSTSGTITIQPQASAGTYNFNLPTSAGSSGQIFVSGGGISSPNIWESTSGTGTTIVSTTGIQTNNDCVNIDSTGNHIDAGAPCGIGTVNSGTINDLAYYASSTNAISALATANNGILITSAGGVPSISSTLPTAVQGNITSLGTITSGTWNGSIIPVLYGGTGDSTLTLNGLLYGNGTSAVQITAQGGANTILTANAGPPSWSASPTIGTSVTTPLTIGGTSASATLTLESTSGIGTTDSIIFKTSSQNTRLTISNGGTVTANIGYSSPLYSVTGSSSGTITIQPQTAAGTYNLNLPTSAGSAGQPLLSEGGASTAMDWGSLSGNTKTFGTTSGTLTSGDCVKFDSSGNLVDQGAACGSGTISTGTANDLAYYATSTNIVSSLATANNGVLITSGAGVPSISSTLPSAVQGNITSLGTITSGIWNGSVIPVLYGGTGDSTLTSNGLLYGNGTSAVQVTSQGGANTVLAANSGAPFFTTNPIVTTAQATSTIILGSGDATSSPVAGTLRGTNGSGSNIGGSDITITSGQSTGNVVGGTLHFQSSIAGSSGSTTNSLTDFLSISPNVNGNNNGAIFGTGHNTSSPSFAAIYAPAGSGSNISGGPFYIHGGQSTGTGNGGNIIFQYTPAGSSGSSLNSYSSVLTIDATNHIVNAAIPFQSSTFNVAGSSSGVISILPQAAAGTYNFNLPTSAGSAGQPLLSEGGASAAMIFGTLGTAAGGTGLTSGTANNLLYWSSSSVISNLATANNGTLVTSGVGVPSISSTLPTAVQGNITSLGTITSGTWNGTTIATTSGGTGVGTLTLNGVIYGNGTGNLQATAQGGANTILTANSGAPSWSSSPVIGTSVTTPSLIGGTSASSTLTLESTSGSGTTDSILFKTASQTEAGRINTGGEWIIGKGEASATPVGNNLRAPSGSGSNISGGALTVEGGQSTGNGNGGNVVFKYSAAGVAGSSSNAYTTALTIDATNLIVNSAIGIQAPNFFLAGSSSGLINMKPQAAAGTYNFNLPTTAGSAGSFLYSGGGGSTAMNWLAPGASGTILTGTGSTPAYSASPTLTTSLTDPLVIGGTGASSTLTLQSTSGAGTSDAIIFDTASQAEAGRITTSGNFVIGSGEASGSPSGGTLRAPQASGTNITGTNLTIEGGQSTGNAYGGKILLQVTTPGSSGTTLASSITSITASANVAGTGAGTVIGNNDATSTPSFGAIFSPSGSGTNIGGGTFYIHGGSSTGNAIGGDVVFQTTQAGTSGTSQNSYNNQMIIHGSSIGWVQVANFLAVGNITPTASQGEVALQKITASGTAPGAGSLKFETVAGTLAGTCKLIAYAGTSTTPSTILDNIGGGC